MSVDYDSDSSILQQTIKTGNKISCEMPDGTQVTAEVGNWPLDRSQLVNWVEAVRARAKEQIDGGVSVSTGNGSGNIPSGKPNSVRTSVVAGVDPNSNADSPEDIAKAFYYKADAALTEASRVLEDAKQTYEEAVLAATKWRCALESMGVYLDTE